MKTRSAAGAALPGGGLLRFVISERLHFRILGSPPSAELAMNIAAVPASRSPLYYGCLLIASALAVTGCEAHRAAHTGEAPAQPVAKETPAVAIDLQTVSREGFDQVIASHKGKVVLVDFWATWCGPCVKQFPHTVELSHKYKDKGLDVISVSVDELKEQAEVSKFLSAQGANFDNLITEYGMNAIDKFDVDNGAVPCYWIYDREGKLVERISPADPTLKFSPQVIDDAVERLLAAGTSEAVAADAAPAVEPAPATDAVPPVDAAKPEGVAKPTP
jgi:thiol-disulfide isomerase/thioredoxin